MRPKDIMDNVVAVSLALDCLRFSAADLDHPYSRRSQQHITIGIMHRDNTRCRLIAKKHRSYSSGTFLTSLVSCRESDPSVRVLN